MAALDYFIVYYNVTIEIKRTINAMHLNHPRTIPSPPNLNLWKNCLPQNRPLVPERLGTAALLDHEAQRGNTPACKSPSRLPLPLSRKELPVLRFSSLACGPCLHVLDHNSLLIPNKPILLEKYLVVYLRLTLS